MAARRPREPVSAPCAAFFAARTLDRALARDLVCFDLDGTLLDPRGSIRASIDHAVTTHGLEGFASDEVLIGMPLRRILETRTRDGAEIASMVEAFRHHYTTEAWRLVRFYEGMREAVEDIRSDGFATAVVTTKGEEEAHTVLGKMGVLDLFETIVGDDDVRPLKPDPAPVLAACRRTGRRPEDACMVGDTRFDVEAGRRAGAFTVGVRWGTGWDWGAPPDGADVLVADAGALLPVLQQWRNEDCVGRNVD